MSATPEQIRAMTAALRHMRQSIGPAQLPPELHARACAIVRDMDAFLAHERLGEPWPPQERSRLRERIWGHATACLALVGQRRAAGGAPGGSP